MNIKILMVGISKNGIGATKSIMTELATKYSKNCEIYYCGYRKNISSQDTKHELSFSDPRCGIKLYALLHRVQQKIFRKLQLDNCILGTKNILKHLQKYSCLNFDLVIGVAGVFSFMEAAYLFAIKNNIPLKLVYFDPFTNSPFTKNINKRLKLEYRWLSYANKVYYNIENIIPEYLKKFDKIIEFYIPIYQKQLTDWHQNNIFIYGGSFYKGIREPKLLYKFASQIKDSGFFVECYSNLKLYPKNLGIRFFPMLNKEQFEKKCLSAKALIYIGNSDKNFKSSKYLEYIAYHKPIIGINVESDNEVRKYKYYFDSTDPQLIDKLNNINSEELKRYNPFVDFPNRDPKKFAEELFGK